MAEELISITLNPEIDKQLHTFPSVAAGTKEVAESIAEAARSMAPVATGAYRDGIVVNTPSPKGVSRVVATDQKSAWIEFGTSAQPAVFSLRNAVESLGLQFKKKSG